MDPPPVAREEAGTTTERMCYCVVVLEAHATEGESGGG